MTAITVNPRNKKEFSAITKLLESMEIPFKTEEKPYNPEFVKKVLDASEQIKKGEFVEYTEDLKIELFGEKI